MPKDYPVVYVNEQGETVFNEGCNELNDDWIKELEKQKGNPEQKAYEVLKKKYKKMSKKKDKRVIEYFARPDNRVNSPTYGKLIMSVVRCQGTEWQYWDRRENEWVEDLYLYGDYSGLFGCYADFIPITEEQAQEYLDQWAERDKEQK